MQFFYIYGHIVAVMKNQVNETSYLGIINDIALCVYYIMEIQSIVWISQAVMKEVKFIYILYNILNCFGSLYLQCKYTIQGGRTGRILYKVAMDVDDRVNKCVQEHIHLV